jgi:hypothetical protein
MHVLVITAFSFGIFDRRPDPQRFSTTAFKLVRPVL